MQPMVKHSDVSEWAELAGKARARLLQLHFDATCGHLGGNLSALDILIYLHHFHMRAEDVFVLSKGHAAGALYVTLWSKGIISDDELKSFHQDGTTLCGHITSEHGTFATGSLGHGLPLAAGMALSDKLTGRKRRIYCLVSDGELAEGSTKEALEFRELNKLHNLVVMVDNNGWQGFGTVGGLAGVKTYNGHDFNELKKAFDSETLISFKTIKGRGTHYADTLASHYLPLTREQYEDSLRHLAD
jgi:transketolase